MTRKNDIPEIFRPLYCNEKSYIVKLDDNFTDDEYQSIKDSLYDSIFSHSEELKLSETHCNDILVWIRENKTIKIKGIAWIRAFARFIKQFGIKDINTINNAFSLILKQRAILLNGDALKIYVTRPGDSKDPYKRGSMNSADWGNAGSCWYKSSYSYHLTYDELIEAGELYAIIISDSARRLIYRFWAMRDESAPDAIAVFNCYRNGERSDGWEDYKILASNLNSPVLFRARFNSSGLYINNDIGYIMTHHTLLKNQERINTCYDVSEEREDESNIGYCTGCNTRIGEDDNYQEINGSIYCDNCFSHCRECDEYYITMDGHTHDCPECGESYDPSEYDDCPHCAELRHCTECNEDYYISDGHFHICECGAQFDIEDIDDCPNTECPTCRRNTRLARNAQLPLPNPDYNSTRPGLIPGKYYRWDGPPATDDENALVSDMRAFMDGNAYKCIECIPSMYGCGIRFNGGILYTYDENNWPHFIESESIPENEEN